MKIDAHQHFWIYSEAEFSWLEPDLRQDFLPADLRPRLQGAGYEGCVAVQAPQTLGETEFLLELAAQNPEILGVVGWVDLRSTSAKGELERFAQDPKFVGVRHIVQAEPDEDFLLRSDFGQGIAALGELGLAYDILVFPRHLRVAAQFVARFPNQRFVIDHLAKPAIKSGALEPWRAQIAEIARCENVFCKLSGMATEADWAHWTERDLQPYADAVLEAFGPKRVMIGSDWPVCLSGGGYERVMGAYESLLGRLSSTEKAWTLGETARAFYRLKA